jgi:hypothetical protein
MNPAHLTRPVATREPVSAASQHPDVPYFPEGGVAAPPFMLVSPLTKESGNGQANELVGPATAEWIQLSASHEQGVGVPPFKRWPRQFHTEAYSFDRLYVMPHPDQVGPINDTLRNRPEKAGWSVPKYGEQYQQPVAGGSMGTGPMNIRDPSTVALAIGWGYIG